MGLNRATWDETWFAVADAVSRRSRCVRAQYGAVIVTPENRIIATGYNGPPAQLPLLGELCDSSCPRAQRGPEEPLAYDDCIAIHAEMNALLFTNRETREYGLMYVTAVPCVPCAKTIMNSGIGTVHCRAESGRDYRDPERAITMLRSCSIDVIVHQERALRLAPG